MISSKKMKISQKFEFGYLLVKVNVLVEAVKPAGIDFK